jgi:orotate phosphoribosyltransferase-like protein
MGKTRGVHETTPEIRNRMVGMYEAGLGLREIAAAVNCSVNTITFFLPIEPPSYSHRSSD